MKYTESHEWIDVEDNIGIVGVTHYAQKELGDIVYVELPEVGSAVNVGDEVAVLESTKAAADIYAPVSGTIVEVNELLNDQPDEINHSPMEEGWIFKIKLSNAEDLDQLMSKQEYMETI